MSGEIEFGGNLNPVSDAPAPPDTQTPADDVNPFANTGLSPTYNQTVGHIESSNGKAYGNGGGIYQFMPGTAQGYGYTQEQVRAMSPEDQGKLNSRFTADNAKVLQARGVPVTDLSAYVAHQQGAGGAAKLFKADQNASAVDVVGKKNADGNKPYFYNDDGTPKTVAEALDVFRGRVTKAGGVATAANAPAQTNKAADAPAPTMRERVAAWIDSRNAAPPSGEQSAPAKTEPEDDDALRERAAEAAGPQITPYQPVQPHSGVVNKNGQVYFQRYGRTFDASGKLVG